MQLYISGTLKVTILSLIEDDAEPFDFEHNARVFFQPFLPVLLLVICHPLPSGDLMNRWSLELPIGVLRYPAIKVPYVVMTTSYCRNSLVDCNCALPW